MTNPLSPKELAACRNYFDETPAVSTFWEAHKQGFAAALDYLRAELAKEEPVCYRFQFGDDLWFTAGAKEQCERSIKEAGIPATIEPLYLRPSETSKCPFIETSKGGTSYCRLAAGQSKP